MKQKFKLSNAEIKELLDEEPSPTFPKYSTQIINLANQNAQGTRPKVVGQMSELIQEFSGKTMKEWEQWYLERYPKAIEKATNKIVEMIENFKEVLPEIDQDLVAKWVRDLIIVKTFIGLRFQEAILKKIAEGLGTSCRLADPQEEAAGIDGFIGSLPVSIKPESYKTKDSLPEGIDVCIVFYKKVKDGIVVDMEEVLKKIK